jgi:hypothetical protein
MDVMLNFSDGRLKSLKCSAGTNNVTLQIPSSENLGSGLREATENVLVVFIAIVLLVDFPAIAGIGRVVYLENVRVLLDVCDEPLGYSSH